MIDQSNRAGNYIYKTIFYIIKNKNIKETMRRIKINDRNFEINCQ